MNLTFKKSKADALISKGDSYTVSFSVLSVMSVDQSSVGTIIKQFTDCMEEMPLTEFRQLTEKYGFNYGPAFSLIKRAWQKDNQGVCLISVDENIIQDLNDYVVHPAILDACLQSCFIPLGKADSTDRSVVPVGFECVTLTDHSHFKQLFCHTTMKAGSLVAFDVALMSPHGNILVTIEGIQVAEVTSSASSSKFEDVSYEVEWIESPLQQSSFSSEDRSLYIILMDSTGFGDALIEKLQSSDQADVVSIDLPSSEEFDEHAKEMIKNAIDNIPAVETTSNHVTVVNLWPKETYLLPNEFDIIDHSQALSFHSSVFLMQMMSKKDTLQARLFLVSRATQVIPGVGPVPKASPIPWGSSVWGFRRTALLEKKHVQAIAVDLGPGEDPCEVELLTDEMQVGSRENEIAYRHGKRFVNRIIRLTEKGKLTDHGSTMSNGDGQKDRSLCLTLHPQTKSICLKEQTMCGISDQEIEVEVLFSWNLSQSILNLIKGQDCVFFSGRVTAISEASDQQLHSIGDNVCGVVTKGRFGNRLMVASRQCFPHPTNMTHEQAATLPACLAIAYHAIQRLVGEHHGQRILIHEANEGPGLAAVLITRALGHTAVCTSSAEAVISKKMFPGVGTLQVMNANWLNLATEACDPVDATLFFYEPLPNMVQKSFQVLKRGGKLLVCSAAQEGDVVLHANKFIVYERLDIAEALLVPGKFEELFSSSLLLLEQKELLESLLDVHQQSIDVLHSIQAHNANVRTSGEDGLEKSSAVLTTLSFSSLQSENISSTSVEVLPPSLDEYGLKSNRTYMVVGGIRGFGFEVGRWMAENGAKTVALVARSPPTDTKRQEVVELEQRTGAQILMFQVSCLKCAEQRHLVTRPGGINCFVLNFK